MNKRRLLILIILAVFLSGCALTKDWTRRQTTAATAATSCAIIGAGLAGGINHNNSHSLSEGQAIPIGAVGGALLCGGLAYLLTPEPPPPPPKPAPPTSAASSASATTTASTTEAKAGAPAATTASAGTEG
jgi:hypothetical protein